MPLVSALTKSLQVKIVYYGPGLSGKTTNLEKLAVMLDKERVGELMSLDTSGDRTLFFDWMPLDLGKIRGFDVKIQLYTVPGQIRYDRTRQQVLRGVDGIVFIADSQRDAVEQNLYSFKNLRDNLALSGRDLEEIPVVIQCNKKDLPNTMSTREMALSLHAEHLPFIEASASSGQGVLETLRLITRLTMKYVQAYLDPTTARGMPETSQEPLDGDALLSKMLSSDAILTEHREAEKVPPSDADKVPGEPEQAPAPGAIAAEPATPGVSGVPAAPAPESIVSAGLGGPAGLGGRVPGPDEVDRADSSELTPVVEIVEDNPLARPAAPVEIEAEPVEAVVADAPVAEPVAPAAEPAPGPAVVPVKEPGVVVERNHQPDLSEPIRHVELVTDPIDAAAPPTPVPLPIPLLTPDQVQLIVDAASGSSAVVEALRLQVDGNEARIRDLELLVARQSVQIENLNGQLAHLRRILVQAGRDLDL